MRTSSRRSTQSSRLITQEDITQLKLKLQRMAEEKKLLNSSVLRLSDKLRNPSSPASKSSTSMNQLANTCKVLEQEASEYKDAVAALQESDKAVHRRELEEKAKIYYSEYRRQLAAHRQYDKLLLDQKESAKAAAKKYGDKAIKKQEDVILKLKKQEKALMLRNSNLKAHINNHKKKLSAEEAATVRRKVLALRNRIADVKLEISHYI